MSDTGPAIIRGPARHDVAVAEGSGTAIGRMGEASLRTTDTGEVATGDAPAAHAAATGPRDLRAYGGDASAGARHTASLPPTLPGALAATPATAASLPSHRTAAADLPLHPPPAAAPAPTAPAVTPSATTPHARPGWLLDLEMRVQTLATRQQDIRPRPRGLPPVAAPGEPHGSR